MNKNKDLGNKVAVLSTDLSSTYGNVEHMLLMTKLEHMGFRDKAYRLIESYLADRTFYTEVQGFSSGVKFMPTVSVVQGLKLSSLFYSLFTVDTLNFDKIMQDPVLYKQLTGKT